MKRLIFGLGAGAVALGLGLVCARDAQAGGLYFSERGVRPLGRGGAFVAGVNDLHATWFNPAGLADAGDSMLIDAGWMNFSAEFQRRSQIVDAGGTVRVYDYPEVEGTTKFLPLPTLGVSKAFGKEKQFTLAGSLYVPYVPVISWPERVNGQPAPQRYSAINSDGSALAIPNVSFAWKINEKVQVGATFQVMAGKFNAYQVLTANPSDRLIGAPEDPRFDTYSRLSATIVTPSGVLGVIATPIKALRLGLAFQLPFWVDAPATNRVRLPDAAIFDKAYQDGEKENVTFRLPPVLRVGAQYTVDMSDEQKLAIEAAYVREFWSMHDTIDIEHVDFRLRNVTGFPDPFKFGKVSLQRNFQDSNSFRLGAEYTRKGPIKDGSLSIRGGLQFETTAVPTAYVSPLALDANKLTPSLGVGLGIGRVRIDAVFAYILAFAPNVDPGEAAVARVNPASGFPTKLEAINGGNYAFRAQVMGLGMEYKY